MPTRWTPAELATLRELYPDNYAEVVARKLGRVTSTVHQAAARYGIKKSAAFITKDRQKRWEQCTQSNAAKAAQFKPGQVPWNAGLKGWQAPNTERTQFKPGNRPHTWRPVGTYRVTTKDCYLELKVNDNPGPANVRWVPVHRLVWIAAHGPIPDGYVVVFKPGQKTTVLEDITIDRLACITRGELARRNSPYADTKQLGQLAQLKGAITRQVNRITREARG